MRQHVRIAAGVQHGVGAGRVAGVAEDHQPDAVASIPGERPAGGSSSGYPAAFRPAVGGLQAESVEMSANAGADTDAGGGDPKSDNSDDDKLVHDDVFPRR
jgi:hypothetical protein